MGVLQDGLAEGARVLLVRTSALGDVLFALETLASLKAERPDVTVDYVVDDRFAGVLEGHPSIDTLHRYPRKRRRSIPGFLLHMSRQRYDAVLDLHGILKSALIVAAVRSKAKVGYAPGGSREGAHHVYHRAVTLPQPLPHRAARGYHLLRALGLKGEECAADLGLPPSDTPPNPARGPRVAIHPGTSAFAAFKRWPVDKHAQLARRLLERGIEVQVTYGPGEEELAAELQRQAPQCLPVDGRELGLRGLAALYRDLDAVIAGDTGPLHLATAAGTPVVALFGPKDPALYGPRGGDRHAVLYHDVPCRPCTRRRCPAPLCVRGIDVATVEAAVVDTLERTRPAGPRPLPRL